MLSRDLERRMAEAAEDAKQSRCEFVTLEHILMALTNSASAQQIFTALGVDVTRLKTDLRDSIKKNCPQITVEQLSAYGGYETWQPEFTLACHRLIQRAALQVRSAGKTQISDGHLLVAYFYEQDSFAVHALSRQGVTQFDVINYISHGIEKDGADEGPRAIPGPDGGGKEDIDGLPQDESKNSPLESFCTNLNEKAESGKVDPLIGRADVLERVMQVLCRRTKNNPLLIGEPGVGKTAIAEGLAARIVAKDVPEALADKVIYSLDLGSLLAGTKFRGDFEGRIKGVLKEIKKRKNAILFIDEIHTIVGAGSTSGGSMDASNLLKPALANGDVSCVGSTTYTEFRQHFEKDRALNRRFQRIDVKEPSLPEAMEILKGLRKSFEKHHNVTISDDAITASVELSAKYLTGKLLPDKAIDVLDEAGADARLKGRAGVTISTREIEETIARMAMIPASTISANELDQLKDLDRKLKSVIYGQDEAIDRLVAAIKFSRSGLGRDNKPIGTFLFTGPTGVGKTEVCRKLADFLGVPLTRFDMSEYMEKHTVARLVGAPPGYVGFEEGGQLTEAVTKSPYTVLLFDEMEKAHTDVYNILLQVMDAGRLTDANGRTTDFRNVILIMTSNAGAAEVARGSIGLVETPRSGLSMEALKKNFAPEFLNRLDAIVTFKDLDEGMVLRVVHKFIEELRTQLVKKNVELNVSAEAAQWLLKRGYDKVYGARPMARAIDEHIKRAMVDKLLFGDLAKGGRLYVDVKDNQLTIETQTLETVH
ncbi:MAG: ATP-dependent Clp protease ATP-binding subunit ClpA [Bdellovibrionaceae bacterium]|nr:ATP-dependent Clp protease ATP-binding subunit ClpA [Pseudobdellovibrionaceae bacterium]